MEIIKKRSLLASLVLYFMLGMLCSELVYYGANLFISYQIRSLMNPRPAYVSFEQGTIITLYEDEEEVVESTEILDSKQFKLLQQIQKILPVFIFGCGVLITAYIYYKRKLKSKLELLKKAAEEIGRQNLDFSTECREDDEIGALCNSFESMRKELKTAFEKVWEEEKKNDELFQAFAHDLRTPLTVLKGNNELLLYLLPAEEKDKQEIHMIFESSENAIQRIERYASALKEFKDIERWEPEFQEIASDHLAAVLQRQCIILSEKYKKEVRVQCDEKRMLSLEMTWLQLILDKLLENAFRFARTEVVLNIEIEEDKVRFVVEDDGEGFSPETMKKAKEMFYSADKARGYSGIGLAVAEKLLGRYGSTLIIENLEKKGAKISFCIEIV